MRIEDDTIRLLAQALSSATGPLDHRTALEILLLGHGRLTDFTPRVDRDDFGGWEITYQVDTYGGGRQKCTMREADLPDRSLDAALGLADRLVPGMWPTLMRAVLASFQATGHPAIGALPRLLLVEAMAAFVARKGNMAPPA